MLLNRCFNTVLFFICVTILFTNVSHSYGQTVDSIKVDDKKKTLKKKKTFIVSGKVEQTSAYCGGARPTDEMLKKFATPLAYPNKKFYIRCGKINSTKNKIIKSFTTDSVGTYSLSLAAGTYSIVLEEQLKKINPEDYINQNQKIDTSCLDEWWKKPYYLLVVKDKNISELNFIFHHRCFIKGDNPCLTYTGPLPP